MYKNGDPLLIVDHAPWYKSAFEWIRGISFVQKTFGIRNYIERWYRTFKQRTKRFFHNFPVRNEEHGIERIGRFLHLFAYWYNHMRPHESFKGREYHRRYLDDIPSMREEYLMEKQQK